MKPPRWFFLVLAVSNFGLCLNAAPFVVILKLQGRSATQSITNSPAIGQAMPKVRPVLHAGVDEPLKLHFHLEQTGKTEVPDAVVHLYIAPEESLNQSRAPDMKSDQIILESALSGSFKTGQIAQGTFSFRVSRPGFYLVRIEGLEIDPAGMETPFASLDLAVDGKAAK